MDNNSHSISIVIPVFNSPHRLRDLFTTLESNSNPSLLTEIIIGDDCSDELTQSLIDQIIDDSPFKIKLIRQVENIGYLENANQLYAAAETAIVVFLNTDTLVPPDWLERIQSAFQSDAKVVLATPFSTNASNLTILPNWGQSWLDLDRYLCSFTPKYPAAHTAVGFCLAVRKTTLKEFQLFDKNYHQGYWEETDLHYRVLEKGFRSVVIDNLLVHHANGSSSFSLRHNLSKLSETNKEIFYKKWGYEHTKSEKLYHKLKPYDYLRFKNNRFSFEVDYEEIDILFVLPAFIRNSGGINIAIDFANYLTMNNIKASIYCYGMIDEQFVDNLGLFNPWRSIQDIYKNIYKIKVVCATMYDSVSISKELSHYYNAKILYLVQGPESLFSSGKYFGSVVNDYQNHHLRIVCVSGFLFSYLSQLKVSHHEFIPLGADKDKFYISNHYKNRNQKSIAACLRVTESKGSGAMLHTLLLAKEVGFEIHLFGQESDAFYLPNDLGQHHGDLSSSELNKLFNSVGYYLDFSYFEGLGLLPLEAANCGAIPILKHNGGSDSLFVDGQSAFFINDLFGTKDFFETLYNKNEDEIYNFQHHALNISKTVSLQQAREAFRIYLLNFYPMQKECRAENKIIINKISRASSVDKEKWYYRIVRSIYLKNKNIIHSVWNKLVNKASEKILFKMDSLEIKMECLQKDLEEILKKLN
ncbi:glycosyltransferase [unidentified bacterial endosymbiont]|uniref:glycosyltransferase n=1 Tax=unidentified bacterial endosymbiont TaxID=2355 RepID=UPI0020A0237E|nr:glycosyltransferase [unidentified bacterial endosymbiont]